MTTGAQTFNSPLWSYDPSAALLVRAGPGTLHACLPNNLCKLLHSQCGMPPSTEPSIPPCLLLLQAAAAATPSSSRSVPPPLPPHHPETWKVSGHSARSNARGLRKLLCSVVAVWESRMPSRLLCSSPRSVAGRHTCSPFPRPQVSVWQVDNRLGTFVAVRSLQAPPPGVARAVRCIEERAASRRAAQQQEGQEEQPSS